MVRLLSAALVFALPLAPSTALGDGTGGTGDPVPAGEDPPEAPSLQIGGKVFALAQADERAQYERDLSIPTARLQVKAGYGAAQAVLEADIASRSLIKDAYVRLTHEQAGLRVYAGQFKAPFLERQLESRWDLPLVARGLVNDFLVDRNQLAGRRIGVMGELRRKHWLDFDVQVGAFQGAKDDLGKRQGEDLAARATFAPLKDRLEIGVDGYWADATGGLHRYAGGADATLLVARARVTIEGLAGRIALGAFTAQVLTATWLLPIDPKGKWAVEPVVGGEGLQLRGPQAGAGRAAVLGLNLHYTDRVKLMLQGERGLFPGDTGLKNRFAVQLAAKF